MEKIIKLREYRVILITIFLFKLSGCAKPGLNLITGVPSQVALLNAENVAVDFGRSTFLDPARHLRISFNTDAKCIVSVVKGNPSSSLCGKLVPESFPCDFKKNRVLYQHYGSLNRAEDAIALLIRVDSEEETQCLPVTLRVKVLFHKPLETLNKVESLIVNELGGLSEPITSDIIRPKFDEQKQTCQARIIQDINGPPFYGSIVNTSDVRFGMDSGLVIARYVECKKLLQGDLRYAHHRSERSPDKDYIPLIVEVCDKETMEVEKREYIRMPVRIKRAPKNNPPRVDYSRASYSLQVDQAVITALTPSVLRVDDRETDAGAIIINVTQQLKSEEGYLIHTDDPSRPVATFFQRDIEALKIAYKPPVKQSTVQRLHQIWLEAIDSEGAKTSGFYIFIIIKPMSSFGPQVTKNLGLLMYEGQSRPLTIEVLEIRDPDNEESVVVTVISTPRHGILEKNGQAANSFTLADIESRALRYVHDDSNSNDDNFLLRVSDGEQQIEFLFVVTILSKDDSPPMLLYNTGLTLPEGSVMRISQFDLSATDLDSDDTEILFTLVDAPSAGAIVLRQSELPSNITEWRALEGFYEKSFKKFQQTDLILGHVFYRHNGQEVFTDRFTFRLSDKADVPNTSGLKTFVIDISPVDDLAPRVHPESTLDMKVMEGNMAPFTKQVLRYFDEDSDDNELIYNVLGKPYYSPAGSIQDSLSAGRIVLATNLNKSVESFTQKHVNHFKVFFMALDREIGPNQRIILFDFSVTDSAGNTVRDQRFTIHLAPVNNSPPKPFSEFFNVAGGERAAITSRHLRAQDPDNDEADMAFSLRKLPAHGDLLLSGSKMHIGDTFSMQDLQASRMIYMHDGSATKSDLAEFMLSDGLHSVPVKFPISIRNNDKQFLRLKAPLKNIKMQVAERGFFVLSEKIFNISGDDSDEKEVLFLVMTKSKLGLLERAGKGISSFTFRDIKAGTVVYKHISGEIGLLPKRDLVNLTVPDMVGDVIIDGNRYSGVVIEIEIVPIDSEPPILTGSASVSVNESKRVNIGAATFSVFDIDTKAENVRCLISGFPGFGFVETTAPLEGSEISQTGTPVKSFSVNDLQQGHVFYVQSKHKRLEPEQDKFQVTCTDGANLSPEVTIRIQILPLNDEPPQIVIHPEIVCVEDDYLAFSANHINAVDADLPEDVLFFTVTRQPKHGRLLLQEHTKLTQATTFGKGVLEGTEDKTFLYQHDGSETTADNFEIQVGDGQHFVRKQVNISVISMDDETPRLTVNTGLHIERGDTQVITNRNLKAVDLDSESKRLTFIVMTTPQLGKLQKMSGSLVADLELGHNFTQADIDARNIRYTHSDVQPGDREVIRLDVTDGFNRLINQIFNVLITPFDNTLPDVLNKGVTLSEMGKAVLTTDELSASDLNSPDEKLLFTVTKLPLKGYLENVLFPGMPIYTFSQLDIVASKIAYVHTSDDEIKHDNFEFEVTDGRNKVFRTFRIKLNNINNKIPSLFTSSIVASTGLSVVITPFEIKATDNDTEPSMLRFVVHRLPKHGSIIRDGISAVMQFSQSDLDGNRISYKHDGSRSSDDHFTLTVSDGLHNEFFTSSDLIKPRKTPVRVDVKIIQSDKRAPILRRNMAARYLVQHKNMAVLALSPSLLRADDSDSSPDEISFVIMEPPLHGYLVENLESTFLLERFSQGDVDRGRVNYVLKDATNATSDFFTFDVVDKAMNWLRGQRFHVSWSWIEFSTIAGDVNETGGNFMLSLQRRGDLGVSSFVTVYVVNGSAKENLDIQLRAGRTVQFNPGETKAALRIRIVDNLKYEIRKSLQLTLGDAINSLLGPRSQFALTVLDPEDEPSVTLLQRSYRIPENIGEVRLALQRTGDLEPFTKVYCLTTSGTAKGTTARSATSYSDYLSRLQDDMKSAVIFDTNDTIKHCTVKIVDDALYEEEETFKVFLVSHFGGKIGEIAAAEVTIEEDEADEPKFSFESELYQVDESDGTVHVRITRVGTDLSMKSYVLLATKQLEPASAKAESDYYPVVRTLEFPSDTYEQVIPITIIDDTGRPRIEGKENFTVLIWAPRNAGLGAVSEATVVIDDTESDIGKNLRYQMARSTSILRLHNYAQNERPDEILSRSDEALTRPIGRLVKYHSKSHTLLCVQLPCILNEIP